MRSKSWKDAEKKLIYRYLLWCYKTTKEELDRIDRKFTQLIVDEFIVNELKKHSSADFPAELKSFEEYILKKRADAQRSKFESSRGRKIRPHYAYLASRLKAIEAAIKLFVGRKALQEIRKRYEGEMTLRILQAREHT